MAESRVNQRLISFPHVQEHSDLQDIKLKSPKLSGNKDRVCLG